MNISLPEALRRFVDARVRSGAYGTSSEYLRELLRRDQRRLELRELLLEGLASPVVAKHGKPYWAAKRRLAARGQ